MDKKSLQTEILTTVQQIASLFAKRGIEYSPSSEDHWTLPVEPQNEVLVLQQLGWYLHDLLYKYRQRTAEKSEYEHYLTKFTNLMDVHTEGLRWK